jgi:hypothetical protein
MKWTRLLVLAGALPFLAPGATYAAPFSLCNTGQTAGCGGLQLFGLDPNYTVVGGLVLTPSAAAIADPTVWPLGPGGPWNEDPGNSAWITTNEPVDPVGDYTYETTFDLTGFDPTTASISGEWLTDNTGTLYLNGVNTGFTSSSFQTWSLFDLTSGFISGVNTLDFVVNNADCGGCDNPEGLRVGDLETNATPVPEPASLFLVSSGLLAAFRSRRGRRTIV